MAIQRTMVNHNLYRSKALMSWKGVGYSKIIKLKSLPNTHHSITFVLDLVWLEGCVENWLFCFVSNYVTMIMASLVLFISYIFPFKSYIIKMGVILLFKKKEFPNQLFIPSTFFFSHHSSESVA